MKKMNVTKRMLTMLLGISACILPTYLTSAAPTTAIDDECAQELLLSYFPAVFVDSTLGRFNVPKNEWDAIKKELAARDKGILKLVEAKASKMNPNPLKDPQQRQTAVKIFRETLIENFGAVMKAHGVKDDKQIQAMLDDIQQQKAKRFARCMEMQRIPSPPPPQGKTSMSSGNPSQPISSDDSDDDDDWDEDDNDDDDDDMPKPIPSIPNKRK